jgi:hypothetical protein
MPMHPRRPSAGFTIVELLVVIGVMGLLVGLLLPALSGAQKSSHKLKELNALRQVGIGWGLYANSAADRAVPGYLDPEVQSKWRVSYEYRNREAVPDSAAAPWTWRVLPFLDYGYAMVLGYQDDLTEMTLPDPSGGGGNLLVNIDVFDTDIAGVDPASYAVDARAIGMYPSFGYNAYYVGGWWEMDGGVARYKFVDATVNGSRRAVVATTVSNIKRSSDLITFCSSSFLPRGTYRKFRRDQPGAHYVTPPRLGTTMEWAVPGIGSGFGGSGFSGGMSLQADNSSIVTQGDYDPTSLEVIDPGAAAPIGRYNRLVAILCADGHTDKQTPGALLDMRRWIECADSANFQHE